MNLKLAKNAGVNKRGKDSYYRILANQKIDWRAFLAQFVKQYLLKDELFTPATDATRCLIFDDTDLPYSSKKQRRVITSDFAILSHYPMYASRIRQFSQ